MIYQDIINSQRNYFNSNKTKNVEFRKAQLLKLKHMIKSHEDDLCEALRTDLSKSKTESYLTEISIVYSEINSALKTLDRFARPSYKKIPLHLIGSLGYTLKEPYGTVLILAPWNYPVQLTLAPLVGALAAGNTAIVKSSESSLATSTLLQKLLNETFPTEVVYCLDPKVDPELLFKFKYDYIFFTGSEKIGKQIMAHAAKYLTPVTLELGGKSPTFVTRSANITQAAKRIVWAKLLNAGQTCVAPDYILVDKSVKDEFIEQVLDQIQRQCPKGVLEETYPCMINAKHYLRIKKLIGEEMYKTETSFDDNTRKIGLTLFTHATFNSPIMKEEIFGPILPIIEYDEIGEVIEIVKSKAKPLACYIFSKNKEVSKRIIEEVSFGGGCINDCVMHLANHHLPFGGVGQSGMGSYHGKYSLETFSHTKSIQNNTYLIDLPLRYSKQDKTLNIIRKIMK
ncbi:aldehyde dehydrogenase family protein [Anaerorhabdus furcosa]|uniref:Aldehyde dehydrogenase n=1 Tax=Anaerorhabdus furcosa TaxID=118967 RepID=A0A1T4NNE9_9FIRM|nr:aldehyde dehydrogenase family protein [Anaerorhabdus furcosa]SJZ80288.1 aldehyde dehydrogenase (NAD+) [Anaerorhabdus furcosa]